MKSFIVIGLGRFGYNVATTLYELGNDVLVIDEDEEVIQKISDNVTHAVVGDAKDEVVLKSVGVRNFDYAIVALSQDIQASVLVTLMLKEMGVSYVVARAQSEIHKRVLNKVGADKIVFPERDMGIKFAQSLSRVDILGYIELSDEYSIIEIKVPNIWDKKTLREIELRSRYGISAMAIKRANTSIIDISPNPDEPLEKDDVIVLVGSNSDLTKIH